MKMATQQGQVVFNLYNFLYFDIQVSPYGLRDVCSLEINLKMNVTHGKGIGFSLKVQYTFSFVV